MVFRNGGYVSPHLGGGKKKLQFILHMNKVIQHFNLAVHSKFQYILST